MAQSSFTIRRPVENATVRETVEIRIPRRAIPQNVGFVGIWVNGRFLEAVSPFDQVNTSGSDFVYRLNTKERRIPDGQMTVEAVLYVNRGNFTQPVNKTSVVVRLDNSASIRIPSEGVRLRYRFVPGQEFIYRAELKSSIQSLTEAQAQMGSRAGEVEGQPMRFRYRMTVMNTERSTMGGTDGVLLMQPLPERGRDFAMLITQGATEPRKYMDYEMAPLYMRVNPVGREIWGSRPFFVSSEGAVGDASRLDLFAMFPLPLLPERGVRPGGAPFPGGIQNVELNLDRGYDIERFTQLSPARGELVGLEYERGRPTAKLRTVFAAGTSATGIQSYEEFVWFALDLGMPIKIERNFLTTVRAQAPQAAGQGGGRPNNVPEDQPGLDGAGGRWQTPQVPNQYFGETEDGRFIGGMGFFSSDWLRQQMGDEGMRGQPGAGAGRGTRGGVGGGAPRGGGGTGNRSPRLLRQRTTYTLTLE